MPKRLLKGDGCRAKSERNGAVPQRMTSGRLPAWQGQNERWLFVDWAISFWKSVPDSSRKKALCFLASVTYSKHLFCKPDLHVATKKLASTLGHGKLPRHMWHGLPRVALGVDEGACSRTASCSPAALQCSNNPSGRLTLTLARNFYSQGSQVEEAIWWCLLSSCGPMI